MQEQSGRYLLGTASDLEADMPRQARIPRRKVVSPYSSSRGTQSTYILSSSQPVSTTMMTTESTTIE